MIITNFTEFSTFSGINRVKLGKFSKIASDVIDIIALNYPSHIEEGIKYQRWAIRTLYSLAYNIELGNHMDYNSISFEMLRSLPQVDDYIVKEYFGSAFINFKDIVWDISDVDTVNGSNNQVKTIPPDIVNGVASSNINSRLSMCVNSTSKEDLYLAPPKYPRFDTNVIKLAQKADYDRTSIMYQSLPIIPRSQHEISITTDVDMMTPSDLLKLFPNVIIQTRRPPLYIEIPKLKYYEDIGLVIPIEGFKEKQIVDNIIKYPHLYQLKREVDGDIVPFHTYIEINSTLYRTEDIWDTLPISKLVPKQNEYILEYVVRRYLLERDIKHINHKYPIIGSLDPFLTLFGNKDFYINHGFKDVEDIAKQCVVSRINYKKSRNGIVKNSGVDRCIYAPHCFQHDCRLVCPTFQQVDYLLSQNDLLPPNSVFSMPEDKYQYVDDILSKYVEGVHVIENSNPNDIAKLLTYCSICNHWKGSKFSMSVYQLKFSKYIERMRASWSMREEPDDLQYMKIWSQSSKVLIISNLDYVSFGDVECQALLQLIQDREDQGKLTFVVLKTLTNLVGRSSFFKVFSEVLKGAKIK